MEREKITNYNSTKKKSIYKHAAQDDGDSYSEDGSG